MAKISLSSIKYMIYANFTAEGALEKPDVIGALFGQTEGLLGSDLEMRDLQKEGKIGRIEVTLEKRNKITAGEIKIPTALDQSETALIAAAIETIEKIGPCDAQVEVSKIGDVREDKRGYIIERAKKLMKDIQGSTDSREVANKVKNSARTGEIKEYGKEKLPCGDISSKELIVVEGRADVVNLIRNNIKNVIAMNGTKLPEEIKNLGEEKEITLFVDGDRGGKLIAKNVVDNVRIKYIATAPDGKEVEELTGKELLMSLRKKLKPEDFFGRKKEKKITEKEKKILKSISKEIEGTKKVVILDNSFNEIKRISISRLISFLKETKQEPTFIIIDGPATKSIITASENSGCKWILAKNFETTDTKINLLSL